MYVVKQNKNKKWIIIKKGAKRAQKVFNSKAEAIAYAEAHYKNNYDIDGTKIDNVARVAKKKPLLAFVIILLLLIAAGVVVYLFINGTIKFPGTDKPKTDDVTESTNGNNSEQQNGETQYKEDGITENVEYDDLKIHFMMLGNDAAGDSVYIKAGDTDILIDAGSTADSYNTTSQYINNYCKDNKFEYVIATHGDADHISSFPKFFKNYEVDTCIDFSCETYNQFQEFKASGASTRSYFSGTTKTTATYGNYLKARDQYAKKHYTAGECFLNKNGAKSSYDLSEYVKMTILYNYYFDNDNNGKVDSTDENNFSVCTLFTYSKNGIVKNFILTGDLELEGEKEMAKYYDGSTEQKTLPEVELYKAGHHGSKTSSNDCLLRIIKPKMCVVCCCAGTTEYTNNVQHQFPTQSFINHISKYTSRVYVTTGLNDKNEPTAFNGNIIVSSSELGVGIKASYNLNRLKDTAWFNGEIYAVKASVYKDLENGDTFDVYQNCAKAKGELYTKDTPNAVLIKRRYWPATGVN